MADRSVAGLTVRRSFRQLAWPSALEGLLLMVLSAVDLFMVSALGTNAVAAVSIFGQPRMVLLCIMRALAMTFTIVAAQQDGQKSGRSNPYRTGIWVRQSLTLSVGVSAVLTASALLFSDYILCLAGAQNSYMIQAKAYASVSWIALGVSGPVMAMQGVLAGWGNTRTTLYANMIGNGVNLVFDFLLIEGRGGMPAWGVRGAAVATLLGTCLGGVYTAYAVKKQLHEKDTHEKAPYEKAPYEKELHEKVPYEQEPYKKQHEKIVEKGKCYSCIWMPDREYIKRTWKICAGILAEQSLERVGMFLYSAMVAGLGAGALAVHNICMGICDLYYSIAQGMGRASLVLAGRHGGENVHPSAHEVRRSMLLDGVCSAGAACVLLIFLRVPMLRMYHLEGDELRVAAQIMIAVAVVSFPEMYAMLHAGWLRGRGNTGYVAAYSLISIALIRPALTYLTVYYLHMGLYGAWLCLCLDQTMRAVCSRIGCAVYERAERG